MGKRRGQRAKDPGPKRSEEPKSRVLIARRGTRRLQGGPVAAREVPEGVHLTPTAVTIQREDARATVRIHDWLVKNGDVVDFPAFQLLVRNGFPDEEVQFTTQVIGFPVIALASGPQIGCGALGIGGKLFLAEHQRDGVLLARLLTILSSLFFIHH